MLSYSEKKKPIFSNNIITEHHLVNNPYFLHFFNVFNLSSCLLSNNTSYEGWYLILSLSLRDEHGAGQ